MSRRRIISITSDGYYYLFVLTFIVGGALLRQVNLLIVLAGVMIGLMLFNWRYVVTSLGHLTVRRQLPKHVGAGEPFAVDIVVENGRRWLDNWAVVVEDVVESLTFKSDADAPGNNQPAKPRVLIPHVRARESGRGNYRCRLHRRGRYQFGPLEITTRFPLGLIQARRRADQREELVVFPKLGELHGEWRNVVERKMVGEQHSQPRRSVIEGDHYGLRNWSAGDNRRWIHWRASAKLNELKVREFEQHTSQELALLLDLWDPATQTNLAIDPIEYAVSFAATAIVDACHQNARRVTFAATGESDFFKSGCPSTEFLQEVLSNLAVVQASPANRLPALYAKVVSESSPTTRIIVISTRSVEFTRLFEAAGMTSERERPARLAQLAWIDVARMDWSNLFELDEV